MHIALSTKITCGEIRNHWLNFPKISKNIITRSSDTKPVFIKTDFAN